VCVEPGVTESKGASLKSKKGKKKKEKKGVPEPRVTVSKGALSYG
jgi:hypothetical protein